MPFVSSTLQLTTPLAEVSCDINLVTRRLASASERGYTTGVPDAVRAFDDPAEVMHGDALYLNSSDSFTNISQIAGLRGAKVLTVSGSGDFPLAFVEHGVGSLDIVDISLPACFYSDLKLVSVATLRFEDAQIALSNYAPNFDGLSLLPGEIVHIPFFHPGYWGRINPRLSEPSHHYFDTLLREQHLPLSHVSIAASNSGLSFVDCTDHTIEPASHGLIRIRTPMTSEAGPNSILSPYITSRSKFETAQGNMGAIPIQIFHSSILGPAIDLASYDFVYMSNIGYHRAHEIACTLRDRGAKRVGFTMRESTDATIECTTTLFDPTVEYGRYFEISRT